MPPTDKNNNRKSTPNLGGKRRPNTKFFSKKKKSKDPLDPYNVFELGDEKIKGSRTHNLDEVEDSKYEVDSIASEDDEDIDSDDAYGDATEVNPSIRGSKSKKNQSSDEEESDNDDQLEGGGYIDISEMLNDEADSPPPEPSQTSKTDAPKNSLDDLLKSSGFGDISSAEEFSSDDEANNNEDLTSLVTKAINRKPIRKYLNDVTETTEESEFNLAPSRSVLESAKNKLSMADLLDPLQSEGGFANLEARLRKTLDFKKDMKPLSTPLAKIKSQKINRAVAYEEAKKRVDVWMPIVTQNTEADHLDFVKTVNTNVSAGSLAFQIKPENDLEREVFAVTGENLDQGDEENEHSRLTPEQVYKRQRELARMRELMFRNEIKARRISKIKSKAYHRLLKKDKLKAEELRKELNMETEDKGVEAEVARARERMTMKHRNTGKWAKSLLKHGSRHAENQTAIMDQINEHQRLKSKIAGVKEGYESLSEDDDIGASGDARAHAAKRIEDIVTSSDNAPVKGIMGMKFMQEAMRRKEQHVQEMAKEAIKDLELLDSDQEEPAFNPIKELKKNAEVQGNQGRLAFKGSQSQDLPENKDDAEICLALDSHGQVSNVAHSAAHTTQLSGPVSLEAATMRSDARDAISLEPINPNEKSSTHKASKKVSVASNAITSTTTKRAIPPPSEENPWLISGDDKPAVRKKKAKTNTSDSAADKNVSKIKKVQKENQAASAPNAEVDVTNVLKASGVDFESDSGSDVEITGDQHDLIPIENPLAFKQKELVKLAFAQDKVIQEFEKEKMEVENDEAPQVEDLTLPGWGSWSGLTVKPKSISTERKNELKLLRLKKPGISVENRKDKSLNNVIISHKTGSKLEKYTITHIPKAYASKSHYEVSMQTPVGQEWNPATTHYKKIKPRINTRQGQIIDPLAMEDH